MVRHLVASVRAVLVLTLITGALYPLAVLAVGQLVFRHAASGSPLVIDGKVRGSELIGQPFTRPEYVQGRPSASSYDARSSGGSNLSPVGSAARTKREAERARLREANVGARSEPPVHLLTASASGLDPHVSPEAAHWQAPRVARARGVDEARVHGLIDELVERPTFGFLGEARVNVLALNVELDRRFPVSR